MYPRGLLEVQMILARRCTELTGMPYHDTLLKYTDLYHIFGLRWSEEISIWSQCVAEFRSDGIGIEEAYTFYSERYKQGVLYDRYASAPHWGCFSYDYHTEVKGVDIHFGDRDLSGFGPLSRQRIETRLAELRELFLNVQHEHPDAERVVCPGTWLLNRVEYSRLFPEEQQQYTWVGGPEDEAYQGTGLWGDSSCAGECS